MTNKRTQRGGYYTHCMTHSAEYTAWRNMLERCHNPNNPGYANYGGRGITVCDEWRQSFSSFYAAIGPKPSSKHSIDRIDNSRGYEPCNVRWATRREQQHNMRSNVFLTFKGEALCVYEWSRKTGIPKNTILRRIACGWPSDRILLPAKHRNPKLRGIYFNKRMERWQVILRINGKSKTIGTFDSFNDALAARNAHLAGGT